MSTAAGHRTKQNAAHFKERVSMHYSNGRAAKAGDIVRGRGYSIKHEFTGVLVYANPGNGSCNCHVATVTMGSQVLHNAIAEKEPRADGCVFFGETNPPSFFGVLATLEYGQLDAFVALDPKTGEVLPPEERLSPAPSAA